MLKNLLFESSTLCTHLFSQKSVILRVSSHFEENNEFFLLAVGLLIPQANATDSLYWRVPIYPTRSTSGLTLIFNVLISVHSDPLTSLYSEGTLEFLELLGTPDVYVQLFGGPINLTL